jgi:hypothetical protein
MTITAQSIVKEVQEQLQDLEGIRWGAPELVAHLNDGQREIATVRPDLYATMMALPLSVGARQTLPAQCIDLIEIIRNTDGPAVQETDRKILDLLNPSWYTKLGAALAVNYCYDIRDPYVFYVYPPVLAGASVDAVCSVMPDEVALPGGLAYGAVTGNISGKDTCKNPLIHFVLFRAFSKDAEFGGNVSLSAAHYQMFMSLLSTDSGAKQAVKPQAGE